MILRYASRFSLRCLLMLSFIATFICRRFTSATPMITSSRLHATMLTDADAIAAAEGH